MVPRQRLLDHVVEARRRHALLAAFGHVERGVQDFVDALLGKGGDEEDRHVVQRLEALVDKARVFAGGMGVLLDEVPLIDGDQQPLAGPFGVLDHADVLRFQDPACASKSSTATSHSSMARSVRSSE